MGEIADLQTMDKWTIVITALAGFLGGSVFATLLSWFRGWWYRPRISTRFKRHEGCYVETSVVDQGNQITFEGRFLRLVIKNTGLSTIKGCGAYVTGVTLQRKNGRAVLTHEVMQLRWANSHAELRDIPVGAFFHLDVICLELRADGPRLIPWCNVPGTFLASGTSNPAFGDNLPAATYTFTVLVAADNAKPVERLLSFQFDPAKTELEFSDD